MYAHCTVHHDTDTIVLLCMYMRYQTTTGIIPEVYVAVPYIYILRFFTIIIALEPFVPCFIISFILGS